jgi:hypothetical protein
MRDQYAGDISDFLKFALLRALGDGKPLGVGWYYNPKHDGRYQDGRHREYCDEPKWEVLDPTLFYALRKIPVRSVEALEKMPIWPPQTRFHRDPIPSKDRERWSDGMAGALRQTSLIFLDPDNGLGEATNRHATTAEVRRLRGRGKSVVLIKFPGREKHEIQMSKHHEMLRNQIGTESVTTLQTCVSVMVVNKNGKFQRIPRIRWFTIIDANAGLIQRADAFACRLDRIEHCKASLHRSAL